MKFIICIIFIIILSSRCSNKKYSIKESYFHLQNDSTSILTTEEYGDIQYKIINEQGIPVLIVHGMVGGYDQGIQTGASLLPENQMIVSISRFGYLKSGYPKLPNPQKQCEAFCKVLDHNNIDKVFILAGSAGGTIGFKFVLLYPDRVAGLILTSSAYPSSEKLKGPSGPPSFIYNDFMFKFILNHMPGMQLKMLGITKKEFLESDSTEQKKIEQLFSTILPIKPKKKGISIDLKTIVPDMTINYSDYPIEMIECPILILHAKNDPMAKYDIMELAMKRLIKVETVIYENGGHVLFGHGEENKRAIANFIQQWSE